MLRKVRLCKKPSNKNDLEPQSETEPQLYVDADEDDHEHDEKDGFGPLVSLLWKWINLIWKS